MIQTKRELENTRAKLKVLEEACVEPRDGPTCNDHIRKWTLRSLMKRINQFKEEIARYECGVTRRD